MTLRRVSIRVAAGEAERIAAELLDRFPAGLEERALGGLIELAVYTDEQGEEAVRTGHPEARSELVVPGWEDGWKEFHRPVVAGGIWIGPPWIEPPRGLPTVFVDPGRAFGTGAHPTTRACLELLATLAPGSLLDAGCGSGVLCCAAVRLGFAPVHAVDLDPVAVAVARETTLRNGVRVEVGVANILHDALPAVDVLVANIELEVVEALLSRASARTAVTSGYEAAARPAPGRWEHVERLELDGWAADVFAAL